MEILSCTKPDFDQILTDIEDFWGNDRTLAIHHPIFIYEFGNTAYVIKDNARVVAYLFGFFSQTEPSGYVHLIGVRETYRGKGLATTLYSYFQTTAKQHGCKKLKAITTAGNEASIQFHNNIGMKMSGEKHPGGIGVVKNYSGPGLDRVVFEKEI